MTKTEIIVERAIVTFFETAIGYLVVIPSVNWTKATIAGAIGAGISAVYNAARQSAPATPPVAPVVPAAAPVIEPPVQIPVSDGDVITPDPVSTDSVS